MRIIAGKYRGSKLNTLEGLKTRPTLDKTRESIFNIINTRVIDSVALDLFAGSGAFGIEAISRGASKVYLNDIHNQAIKLIKENVNSLKDLTSDVSITNKDYLTFLKENKEVFDIVFLDPPYSMKVIGEIIKVLIDNKMISSTGVFIAETLKEDVINIEYEFSKVKEYVYGKSKLTVYWM